MNESVWKVKLIILYLGDKDKTQLLGVKKKHRDLFRQPLFTVSTNPYWGMELM